jgi:hypothetical protein
MADESHYLRGLVVDRCRELGVEAAAEFFGVAPGLVKQWVHGSKSPSLAAVERVFRLPDPAVQLAGWEDKEVYIGLPQYKFTNPLTLFSLLGIWDRSKLGVILEYGDAFIAHTRNLIAHKFLASGKPWLWWVDDDMIFPMGNAAWFNTKTQLNLPEKFAGIHAPTRLRSHGKTLVGGLYFQRKEGGLACYAEAMYRTPASEAENAYARSGPKDELRPVTWVATGCLMTHRQVYLDIQEKFSHLAPQHSSEPWHFFSGASDGIVRAFSEMRARVDLAAGQLKSGAGAEAEKTLADLVKLMESAEKLNVQESRLHQGEDVTFCNRARQAGHQPYVDLAVRCGHVGSKVY